MADGLLLLDKTSGMTSHDAVVIARRVYSERSIGHLGTLDPFATGLLLLLFGRSTRLANFISTEPKVYDATIRFGVATDTDDRTGAPMREAPLPSRDAVQRSIGSLTGEIQQMPPAFSAKQVEGVRAHAAARRGSPLALSAVPVRVDRWECEAVREGDGGDVAEIDVRITCGTGTYIRALARDLGALAGSAAHCQELRRTRVGAFDVVNAYSMDQLCGMTPPPRLRALNVVATDV